MSATDQQHTQKQDSPTPTLHRDDESFQQDHLEEAVTAESRDLQSQAKNALFSSLQQAFEQEEQWSISQSQEKPDESQDPQIELRQQIEWAIELASSLLHLGMDLGLTEQQSPPQMSPQQMAERLLQALQHPDSDLRGAAASVLSAMNIPPAEALASDGLQRIVNHLASL